MTPLLFKQTPLEHFVPYHLRCGQQECTHANRGRGPRRHARPPVNDAAQHIRSLGAAEAARHSRIGAEAYLYVTFSTNGPNFSISGAGPVIFLPATVTLSSTILRTLR